MASQMAVVLSLLLTLAPTSSFHAPSTFLQRAAPLKAFNPFELGTAMNPSLHSLPFDMSALAHSLPPLLLSDEFTDAATAATAAVGDAAASVVAADAGNGWFGFLAGPIEQLLGLIHSIICSISPDGAWGWSIILLTVLIKALTYPLSYQQIASTSKMQSLQPSLKALQKKYASNPEVMNQQIAKMYQDNEVNPLAGCIPSIVQLPVFIGLYRAVLNLAKADKLDEPFFLLPSLRGPTYGADPAHGSDWIRANWDGGFPFGTPSLGWHDTLIFLAIPVLLVISQSASMKLLQPPEDPNADPDAPNPNAVLKFLPLLIGWFSLNVPAALGIYWVANNFITTAITLQIKSQFATTAINDVTPEAKTVGSFTPEEPSSFTVPVRDKPAGFASGGDKDEPKSLTETQVVDVEDSEVEVDFGFDPAQEGGNKKGGKRGSKKKKKN